MAVAAAMAAAMVTWTLTWEDSSTWQEGRCENGSSEPCWDCVHKPLHMCNRPWLAKSSFAKQQRLYQEHGGVYDVTGDGDTGKRPVIVFPRDQRKCRAVRA